MSATKTFVPMVPSLATSLGAGVTVYTDMLHGNADETEARKMFPKGVVTKICARISTNTLTATTTVTLMKNGAATGLSFTIGAGADGVFSGTGSVDVARGDNLSLRWEIGAGTAIYPKGGGITYGDS